MKLDTVAMPDFLAQEGEKKVLWRRQASRVLAWDLQIDMKMIAYLIDVAFITSQEIV